MQAIFTGRAGGIFDGVRIETPETGILAVSGPNGCGKSLLCAILAGEVPAGPFGELDIPDALADSVALVQFSQQQSLAQKDGFLQARWHSGDLSFAQTAREFLSFNEINEINPFEIGRSHAAARRAYKSRLPETAAALGLAPLLPRPVLTLSNGEMRRILLARAILKAPRLLVLDDPMAGLDPVWRESLKSLLADLARTCAIVMAIRHPDELPPATTELHLISQDLQNPCQNEQNQKACHSVDLPQDSVNPVKSGLCFAIRKLRLAYGKRVLFRDFDWSVNAGERWAVLGENGSGKTTLFSLISGDNPYAYACDIEVFGHKRKPGRTLASIRRRIAMVSPETQSFFPPDAIVNGRPFSTLSSGEQRLALLDRALSGKPDLLLLDEPCLNLDPASVRTFFSRLENALAARPSLAAVIIAHRPDHIPPSFTRILRLSPPA